MASGPITSWQIDRETMETVTDFILGGSKITADDDCSHEIKRHWLLRRKFMTNLDSVLKNRNITLLTKVHIVKTLVFPVVMCWVSLSCPTLCGPMDCIPPGSLSMEFSRQEYWSGLPFPSPSSHVYANCTIQKAECQRRINVFKLCCWRRPENPLDCKDIKPVNPKGNQS